MPKKIPDTFWVCQNFLRKTIIRLIAFGNVAVKLQDKTREFSDSLADNIGGQRSKFDVMGTILQICIGGSLKNHIVGRGNFSDSMANHYLSILLYHNLIESRKDTEINRTYYHATEKGRTFIEHYNELQKLFVRESNLGVPSNSLEANPTDTRKITNVVLAHGAHPKRILIVDDERDITSAMSGGLEDSGYSVDVYSDPLTALANYKPHYYDLLILDVKMPKMTGFELYRAIRKNDEKINVCFLTAFEMYSDEFRKVFPSMDVRHFIQKPIAMNELVEQINRLLEQG